MSRRLRALLVLLLAAGVLVARHPWHAPVAPTTTAVPAAANPVVPAPGQTSVTEAFRQHRSDVELEAAGRVTRLLPDDNQGSRHQRFLVRVDGGTTVLVAYNLDLAPRVPVQEGDSVGLKGEYVWNDRGGVMHWTHRDPAGRHAAGWVNVAGHRYQ